MSRQNHETINVSDILISDNLRVRSEVATLAGTYTMVATMSPLQVLDPGGASRDVLLPAEKLGLILFFVNTADAAENLVIKEDAGSTTIATLGSTESAVLICDGTTWRAITGTNS